PDNKRITQDIVVKGGEFQPTPGQIVVATIEKQPSKHMPPMGRITEVLGEHMAPGMEIDIAVRAHGLPYEWPDAVTNEVAGLKPEVPEKAKLNRVDLRKLPFVTIDGADARDFDDAVYAKKTLRGWKLWVAIADVSHYVEVGTALDGEAHKRGTSVYFPERVIPMLPEILSNGLCSLNPEVDRLAMVCEMTMNRDGEFTRTRFQEAVIRSHARLIYDDVAAFLDGDAGQAKRLGKLGKHIKVLYALYEVLRAAREERGAIDFETTETRIIYGAERKIERIVPTERNDAHKLIEECMLAANVCTANWLEKRKVPFLYRVHEGPRTEKLEDLRAFLGEFRQVVQGGENPSAKDYARVLDAISERPDKHLIQTVLLRSLSQAVYTPENVGHFGLAYEAYTHFTSPIRRYPDLLTHRAIRHLLRGGSRKDYRYKEAEVVEFGEHCSMTERRADDATRDAVAWLKCEFMMDKVGEVFGGTIASVTSFGLFVELDDIYVEGLVHVTSLRSDYYHFDPVGHRMSGERSGRSYRLGDRIRVKVVRVDLDQRKVDFEPVESGGYQDKVADKGFGKGKKRRKKKR
ncbi:MAG: ribonuclease R, partial [Gammaproteobacteria bacterium]